MAAVTPTRHIDTIIAGHGSTMTVADLREYAQFNRDFANDVRAAKAAGKSADEAAGWATRAAVGQLVEAVQPVEQEHAPVFGRGRLRRFTGEAGLWLVASPHPARSEYFDHDRL